MMSLFEWSTPERRGVDEALPVIANEIYLHIFELIAPSNECLPPEEIETFHMLSRVCRFFANVCLPRVFESVEFSGSIFSEGAPTYKASLGSILCTQIAEEQPLALALAQTVRACHFTLSWGVCPLTLKKKYVAAMTLMTNVRKLQVSYWVVDVEHWNAIAALPSLEDLSFHSCEILDLPVNLAKRLQLKVSRLSVLDCDRYLQSLRGVDVECLRMLTMDFWYLGEPEVWYFREEESRLSQSAVTELQLHITEPEESFVLDLFLEQIPQSLEVLCFSVDDVSVASDCEDITSLWASILDDPTWEKIPSLRSLTVRMSDDMLDQKGKDKLSLTVNDKSPEVRRILHDKLARGSGHTANLRHVNFFGKVFRLVDGQWLEGML